MTIRRGCHVTVSQTPKMTLAITLAITLAMYACVRLYLRIYGVCVCVSHIELVDDNVSLAVGVALWTAAELLHDITRCCSLRPRTVCEFWPSIPQTAGSFLQTWKLDWNLGANSTATQVAKSEAARPLRPRHVLKPLDLKARPWWHQFEARHQFVAIQGVAACGTAVTPCHQKLSSTVANQELKPNLSR